MRHITDERGFFFNFYFFTFYDVVGLWSERKIMACQTAQAEISLRGTEDYFVTPKIFSRSRKYTAILKRCGAQRRNVLDERLAVSSRT